MLDNKGTKLIEDLLGNPTKFSKQGKAYALLQEYFEGFDIDTLRPLLKAADPYIQSVATFIVSELGEDGCSLLEDVIPLLASKNISIRYECLESIMVCSANDNFENFMYILLSMEDKNKGIRILAMELLSRANKQQIETMKGILSGSKDGHKIAHLNGLVFLLDAEMTQPGSIRELLLDDHPIARKYGAILAKKVLNKFPELIRISLDSKDADIRTFAKEAVEENNLT